MSLIKTCEIHHTVYYKVCSECLHELAKAEKAEKKAENKRKTLIAKAKLQQSQPKKVVKKVSSKQKIKNKEYSERVKEWKKENPKCKAMVDPDCTGETRDCHHMKKRGDLLMVEKYWLPVCGYCHDWIGRNSDEARQRGLTINHLEPEFEVVSQFEFFMKKDKKKIKNGAKKAPKIGVVNFRESVCKLSGK